MAAVTGADIEIHVDASNSEAAKPGSKRRSSKRPKRGSLRSRQQRWGFFFISPWLLGVTIFYALPMVVSAIFSLYDFKLADPDGREFVGTGNWEKALFNDPEVWRSWLVTFRFALINLPIGLVVAFGLALLLNSKALRARNMLRTLFYLPSVVPFIASTLIWSQVLNAQSGWLNRIITWATPFDATGTGGLEWFGPDTTLIPVTYTFIGIWGIGNAILINLAGLQGIPTELYEASQLDGAGWWRQLRHITLPMMSPVIFYNLVLGLIGLLQFFLPPYVLQGSSGQPGGSTLWTMVYFYRQAFGFGEMGYGATLAWMLFLVGLVLTILLFGTARRWVFVRGARL